MGNYFGVTLSVADLVDIDLAIKYRENAIRAAKRLGTKGKEEVVRRLDGPEGRDFKADASLPFYRDVWKDAKEGRV